MKLADWLTWSRIILVLPISLFVILDERIVVLVLFCIAALTDLFDGFAARKTNTVSKAGAKLDSWADAVFGIAATGWFLFFFPETLRYWPYVVILILSILAALLVAKWKLGKYTGLHLYSEKAAAFLGFTVFAAFIVFGPLYWLLFTVMALGVLSQLEAMLYLMKGGNDLDAKSMFSD